MNIKKICLPAAAMWLATNLYGQGAPLPLDPAVRTGTLPNGFTYYIRHNEEPKNRVFFYLANKVGSVLETDEQQGLAHFMEHMNFNGTRHFPKNELVSYLQNAGVRFGADLNAYTAFDETVYQLPLPADKPDILEHGIQIIRDWAQEATLDSGELNKERGVILEEKRLRKGAAERMRLAYWPLLLGQSRYATRIPIGTEDVIKTFKPETIREFYKDWYRPDLQALIVVGDIDVNQMEQTIKSKFSDLVNPKAEKPRPVYRVPLSGRNNFLALTDPEMTAIVAQIFIKHQGTVIRSEKDYSEAVMKQLFNSMLNERFRELTRHADPPFVEGGISIDDFLGSLDNLNETVVVKSQGLERGLKTLWREAERIKRFGFTLTELERAKQSYLRQIESALKEKDKNNSENYVKEYLAYFLKGEASPGIDTEYELVRKDMPQITLSALNQLAKSYIRTDNRDIVLMAPESEKAGLPDEKVITGWMKDVESEELKPYGDEVSNLPFLREEPVSGKIIKTEKETKLNVSILTLSNGVKVILKPTDFKNNEILFSAFSPGGTSLYSDTDYQSAANAGSIIPSFGAGNYNSSELVKFLSGHQAGVQPYINERSQGLSGSCIPKDLETAFQLVFAYLTEPRKDDSQFAAIIQRLKANLANRGNDPSSVFKDSVSALLGGYNIRRTGPTLAKLDQIDLDKSYNIYRDRLGDASGITFTFVGNIDTSKINPLIEKYIASLPATNRHEEARDLGIHVPPGRIERNIYKGQEPKATVQLFFTGKINYNAREKQLLEALKEVLEIRLLERLREDESGVYSPGVYANTSKQPHPRYSLVIAFGCAPQNTGKLISSTLAEIKNLQMQGPPETNVDKYKAEEQRTRETAVRTNNWWLSYITGQLQDGAPLNESDEYQRDLMGLTRKSLQKAAQRYFDDKNFIRFILLPENNKSDLKSGESR